MLFHKKSYDAIIKVLAIQPGLSARQIWEQIDKKYRVVTSLANVYKLTAEMLDKQVVVKIGGVFSLHTTWMMELKQLSTNIQKVYEHPEAFNISLCDGEQQKFHAPTLMSLDPIRNDIFSSLVLLCPKQDWYYYKSHPYHILGVPQTEKSFLDSMAKYIPTTYYLIGNDNFLDKYGASFITMNGYNVCTATNTPFLEKGYCVSILGDYILEIVFPEIVTEYFAIFFSTVKSEQNFNSAMYQKLFTIKDKFTLRLTRSQKDAIKMKQKIKKFFG